MNEINDKIIPLQLVLEFAENCKKKLEDIASDIDYYDKHRYNEEIDEFDKYYEQKFIDFVAFYGVTKDTSIEMINAMLATIK